LILFRGKVYIPKNIQLRHEIIQLHHDTPVAGHLGQWKTLEMVTQNYWWPGITKLVFDYVDGYDKCPQYKNFPQPPAGRLMPIGTPVKPWKAILVNFIVGLPEAQGHNALLVVVVD